MLEDQITFFSVALEGSTVTYNFFVCPTFSEVEGGATVTLETGITFAITVMVQLAVLLLLDFVVIFAVPSLIQLIFPFSSTVTILGFELIQVNNLLVALSGRTAAVNLYVSPFFKVIFLTDTEILSTATTLGRTVTKHFVTMSLLVVAFMIVSPAEIAAIFPSLLTLAIAILSEDQMILLSVTLFGRIVADIFLVMPSSRVTLFSDREILVGYIIEDLTVTLQVAILLLLDLTVIFAVPVFRA